MPGIDVSALNGGDLRRLLKLAHARHDGHLADRLEWEIATRATRGVRPEADAPFLPGVREPASGRRSVLLVTLGAVGGSLLAAAVFWGLARMNTPPRPHGMAAQLAPHPLPPRPQPVALEPAPVAPEAAPAPVEAAAPAATPPVVAARNETPPPTTSAQKKPVAAKAADLRKAAAAKAAARTARASRPPTLDEWLAQSGPKSPIH
jgi:hypothetical protein